MSYEQTIMQIIANSGEARSKSLKASRAARGGDFEQAEEFLKQAKENLTAAHKVQTQLLQAEGRGEKSEITVLLIHAQDHLMNAITVKELVSEMVEESKKRVELEERIKELKKND
ncbi:PTS lactose/cellobiose transporter subunit IIA [Paenibacillus antibioticophila]|uniref:PTS lactose/cellobiose transporter subunit IIA n=1 Tax=Paenibacillus antibioticophila TaxID=1274374 RepID=UPI0005CA7195|nr:PTS lactose/cellobiose transporter subunit IIA [Paenibacillus antibioticophila]